MIPVRPIGQYTMTQRPPADGAIPDPATDDDDDAHTRTLTDLFDELDRAAFRRALACRDGSPYATEAVMARYRK